MIIASNVKETRKSKTRSFFTRHRVRLKKTQSQFGKLLNVGTSTVYALESNGLVHKAKIYDYLERLGFDPEQKYFEIMNDKI